MLKRPLPSMARTILGDHKRFEDTYFAAYPVRGLVTVSNSLVSFVCHKLSNMTSGVSAYPVRGGWG